mmetsp:Transcript_51592/g.84882  ORF Transcript_51592/g.84882 Transcript_51592/m.84882 type:complete len:317 (+) Transcript_51592:231-1181(+)
MSMVRNDLLQGVGVHELERIGIENVIIALVLSPIVHHRQQHSVVLVLSASRCRPWHKISLSHEQVRVAVPASLHSTTVRIDLDDTVKQSGLPVRNPNAIHPFVMWIHLEVGVVGGIIEDHVWVLHHLFACDITPCWRDVASLWRMKILVPVRGFFQPLSKKGVQILPGGRNKLCHNLSFVFVAVPEMVVDKGVIAAGHNTGLKRLAVHDDPHVVLGLMQHVEHPRHFEVGARGAWAEGLQMGHEPIGGHTEAVRVLDQKAFGEADAAQQLEMHVGRSVMGDQLGDAGLVRDGGRDGAARVLHVALPGPGITRGMGV